MLLQKGIDDYTLNKMDAPKTIKLNDFVFDTGTGNLTKDSQTIRLSPRAAKVLIFLTENPASVVSREQLHESVWPGRVVTDVQISKAINELRAALQDRSEPRQYIETLPKRGYQLICDVKEASTAEKTEEPAPPVLTARVLVGVVLAGIVLAGLAFVTFNQTQKATSEPEVSVREIRAKPGVAVLPFVNLSNDVDNTYFSHGIAEEILNHLSRLDGLRVISRTSSFQFDGVNVDAREVGELLSVSHVLEGSVRKFENRVRIAVRLIETTDGTEIFSLQYDRELNDIFVLQTEIATTVTRNIQPSLLDQNIALVSSYGTTNIPAYEAYLQGRSLLAKRERQEMSDASAAFKKAIAHDASYLLAHSGLVDSYVLRALYGQILPRVYYSQTADSIAILQAADVEFPELLATLGNTERMKQNIPAAIEYLERSLSSNPQYLQAYLWLQDVYLLADPPRTADAISLLKTARSIDPLSTVVVSMLSRAYRENGDFHLAKQTTEEVLALDPTSFIGLLGLAKYYRWVEGDLVDAIRIFYNMWTVTPEFTVARSIGHLLIDLGEFDLAAIWLQKAADIVPASFEPDLQFRWLIAQKKNEEITGLEKNQAELDVPPLIRSYAEILKGNFEKAAVILEERKQRIDGHTAYGDETETLLYKGYLAKKLGNDDQLNNIIQKLKIKLFDKQFIGENEIALHLTQLHLLQDQPSEAIKTLREAFYQGAINHFSSRHSIFFEDLWDNPDYIKLDNEMESYFSAQRDKLRDYPALVPDNPAEQPEFPQSGSPIKI